MNLRKKNEVVFLGERGVDPECQFASNPYHVCAEYCIQNESKRKKNGCGKLVLILSCYLTWSWIFKSNQYIFLVMKLNNQRELKKEISNKKSTNVLPRCKFASNSYHECDLSCFQNELDQNIAEGG